MLKVLAPRLVQACLAAVGDVSVYKLARRVLGERYALVAVSHRIL